MVGVFMLTDLAVCVILPFAQLTAVHAPALEISAQEIPFEELEHGHSELDISMLEDTLLDVHSPIITGGMVESQQSFVLLEAANRGIHNWWVTTPLGKPFAFGEVLRACATARNSARRRNPAVQVIT
jgi:hypothetical protein